MHKLILETWLFDRDDLSNDERIVFAAKQCAGEHVSLEDLADQLNMPPDRIGDLLKALEAKGLFPSAEKEPDENTEEWFAWKAGKELQTPTGKEAFERDARYLGTGARPMRKYPNLWLTQSDLANVLMFLFDSLPNIKDVRQVFLLANNEIATKVGAGRRAETISAFKYLTGHCLHQVQDTLRKDTYLKKAMSNE